jgi:hypothetical protein
VDTSAAALRWFPVVPRPRPPCSPLTARVARICDLARTAGADQDLAAASAVLNQAALLASDCGLADLARDWCHRHARTYLQARPLDARTARFAFEPLVNLARLHIRGGNSSTAAALLSTLYHAIHTGTDTVIDTIPVPVAELSQTPEDLLQLRRWLWTLHLADTSRALTSAGRWQEACAHLERHHGIGRRMLDGRQIAVIGRHLAADTDGALSLLRDTAPAEPWEDVVTACLTMICQSAQTPSEQQRAAMLGAYSSLPDTAELAVFSTRLGLTVIEAAGGTRDPDVRGIASLLISRVIDGRDGYAARDVLNHQGCQSVLTVPEARELAWITCLCALDQGNLPAELRMRLEAALDSSEKLITAVLRECPRTAAGLAGAGATSRRLGPPLPAAGGPVQ